MVVFDTTHLLLLLRPGTLPPLDPNTGNPVTHAEARIAHLVETLESARTRIIIPAPALSELLVRAGVGAAALVAELQRSATFRIEPFDTRAAIELAMMTFAALSSGDKKGDIDAPWTKIKFDRQIVAIAKVAGATTIYTDDGQLRAFAERNGLHVVSLGDLPIPASARQPGLPFDDPQPSADDDKKEP